MRNLLGTYWEPMWSKGTDEEPTRNPSGTDEEPSGLMSEPTRNLLGTYKEPSGLMSEPTRIPHGSCDCGTHTDPTRSRFVDSGSPTDPTHPLFYYNTK